MRFCYADPPYPGMAHLYKNHPDYADEVDHKALIDRLMAEFPDGWALSGLHQHLHFLLPLCPEKHHILSWCKTGAAHYQFSTHVAYRWEFVILVGGRHLDWDSRVDDYWVGSNAFQRADFMGMKPEGFCFWLFRCLGALPGDELVDLFPGSGAVGRAWEKYQRQMRLPMERPPERQLKLG